MKQSKVKRLISGPLETRVREAGQPLPPELQAVVDAESGEVIARMASRGFQLVGRVGEGEGVFVRETDLAALHVHIPRSLYQALAEESVRSEMPKRRLVIAALEEYLDLEQ